MTRFMYDSINVARLPATAKMYAGYKNGRWPTFNQLRAMYPQAKVISIAVSIAVDADVLDVEKGDAYPTQAPSWVVRQRNRGATPCVYCSLDTWPAVKQAFRDAGVEEPLYWIAHYDGMSAIPDGAVAKQYTGGDGYDLSSVADYWPGIDPVPAQYRGKGTSMVIVRDGTTGREYLQTDDGALHYLGNPETVTAYKGAGVGVADPVDTNDLKQFTGYVTP